MRTRRDRIRWAVLLAALLAVTLPSVARAATEPMTGVTQPDKPKGWVLVIRGGGWSDATAGEVQSDAQILAAAGRFVQNGWGVKVLTYRAGPQGLLDIENAYLALRDREAARLPVCAWGYSAGGHLAMLLRVRQRSLSCVISVSAPTDLTGLATEPDAGIALPLRTEQTATTTLCALARASDGAVSRQDPGYGARVVGGLARERLVAPGSTEQVAQQTLSSLSPVTWTPALAPLMIAHPDGDVLIPRTQHQRLLAAVPGATHVELELASEDADPATLLPTGHTCITSAEMDRYSATEAAFLARFASDGGPVDSPLPAPPFPPAGAAPPQAAQPATVGEAGATIPPPTLPAAVLERARRACPVTGRVVSGTGAADTRNGSRTSDLILGLAGPDELLGLAGADCLFGHGDADRLRGGPGADSLFGGGGRDHLAGGTGDDVLAGDAERDVLVDTHGRDRFQAGAGDDRIDARDGTTRPSGRDIVSCGAGRRDVALVDRGDRVGRDCESVRVR